MTPFQLYQFSLYSLISINQYSYSSRALPVPGTGGKARGGALLAALGVHAMKATVVAETTTRKKNIKNPSSSTLYHYVSSPRAICSLQVVPCSSPSSETQHLSLLPGPAFPCMVCAACVHAGLLVRAGEWGSKPSPASAAS